MSQTDGEPARSFFADLLMPLRHANHRRHVSYLDDGPQEETYWRRVTSRTGGLQKLSAADCGGAALIELLAPYWAAQSDLYLPKLLPRLQELRCDVLASRSDQHAEEARLPEFVYVLF
jgi:hypothetical protein